MEPVENIRYGDHINNFNSITEKNFLYFYRRGAKQVLFFPENKDI